VNYTALPVGRPLSSAHQSRSQTVALCRP